MTASNNGKHSNSLPITIDEIQYTHDLLNAILADELPMKLEDIMELDEQIIAEMTASLGVLCWFLGHDNQQFKQNMMNIEEALGNAGITFEIIPNE